MLILVAASSLLLVRSVLSYVALDGYPVVQNTLFQPYCSSRYGSELWNLNCNKFSEYCSAWRRGLRRIWELPYTFRRDYLSVVSGTNRHTMNCVGVFWTLLQRVILVILSLFVLLLSMLYYVRVYSRLLVVITWCVTRDMASRWRMNLGLVSNLRAAVVRSQSSCLLLTAVILLCLSWKQVFCTLLDAYGVERKSIVCWLYWHDVTVCSFFFFYSHF